MLMMQLTRSKFVLAARGVQLDNGVTSPCVRHPPCANVVMIRYTLIS